MCSVCSLEKDGESCLVDPPKPVECRDVVTGQSMKYCAVVSVKDTSGGLISFVRSCSPIQLPSSCFFGHNKKFFVCQKVCTETACN